MWMYELAIIEYLSEQEKLIGEQENFMTRYYEKVMNQLKKLRKKQGKKFWNQTVESQRKKLPQNTGLPTLRSLTTSKKSHKKMLNQQVLFFRQCANDHPEAVQNVKFE